MDVLDAHVWAVEFKLNIREVPDTSRAVVGDSLRDAARDRARNGEDDDVRRVVVQPGRELRAVLHGDALNDLANDLGVEVKGGDEAEALIGEAEVFHERVAEVADADDGDGVAPVHAENA